MGFDGWVAVGPESFVVLSVNQPGVRRAERIETIKFVIWRRLQLRNGTTSSQKPRSGARCSLKRCLSFGSLASTVPDYADKRKFSESSSAVCRCNAAQLQAEHCLFVVQKFPEPRLTCRSNRKDRRPSQTSAQTVPVHRRIVSCECICLLFDSLARFGSIAVL